ncbi:MAG: ABC transporter ATP-binding protein [Acidimicrobiia bacterium]
MSRIEMTNVSAVFPDGTVGFHPASITIEPGELVAVIGPSGSGKTTLIRLIAGLERPVEGEIRFDGRDVTGVAAAGRGVGMVVTQGALYEHMSIEDNLRFPLKITGVGEPEQTERAGQEADRFGISNLLGRRPRQLSAGERQLVASGRATVRGVAVLLFDEALAGIDPHLRRQVREQLRALHDGTRTIVYATNEQEEAMILADRLIVLDKGRIQQIGPPLELYQRPGNVFVAGFLGSPGMNIVAAEPRSEGRLRVGDDEIQLPGPAPSRSPLLVGIRPEEVRLARPGDPFAQCLHAGVTGVENLGAQSIIHVAFGSPDSGALDFAVVVIGGRPPAIGDRVELVVAVDKLSYFDRESGERL